jgi:hypothetical protein
MTKTLNLATDPSAIKNIYQSLLSTNSGFDEYIVNNNIRSAKNLKWSGDTVTLNEALVSLANALLIWHECLLPKSIVNSKFKSLNLLNQIPKYLFKRDIFTPVDLLTVYKDSEKLAAEIISDLANEKAEAKIKSLKSTQHKLSIGIVGTKSNSNYKNTIDKLSLKTIAKSILSKSEKKYIKSIVEKMFDNAKDAYLCNGAKKIYDQLKADNLKTDFNKFDFKQSDKLNWTNPIVNRNEALDTFIQTITRIEANLIPDGVDFRRRFGFR